MMESSQAFGPEGVLVGTVCRPDGPGSAGLGMVLFNAGLVHRIGPHRINVRLARSLAEQGIPSIRFDLSGQGDSGRRTEGCSFEENVFQDIAAAMDLLGSQTGVTRFAIFGFCSGGVHGFAASQRDRRIAGLVLYDTYLYPNVLSRINHYVLGIRDRGFMLAAADWFRRRFFEIRARGGPNAPAIADSFRTPSRAEYAGVLRQLAARGVRIAVIYSGSFSQYNYRRQFQDTFRWWSLGERVTCHYFPDMGHSTTVMAQQRTLIDLIVEWMRNLDARP